MPNLLSELHTRKINGASSNPLLGLRSRSENEGDKLLLLASLEPVDPEGFGENVVCGGVSWFVASEV